MTITMTRLFDIHTYTFRFVCMLSNELMFVGEHNMYKFFLYKREEIVYVNVYICVCVCVLCVHFYVCACCLYVYKHVYVYVRVFWEENKIALINIYICIYVQFINLFSFSIFHTFCLLCSSSCRSSSTTSSLFLRHTLLPPRQQLSFETL